MSTFKLESVRKERHRFFILQEKIFYQERLIFVFTTIALIAYMLK